ncbi:MAG TPA: zinc ribbon domain-containing protein [Acidobacteriaceae bacterium]|nr:zinc ribbon domain-containing protein [Acidobacteriaceae bacterium]
MYCSACGQPMDPYAAFCPGCGRQATPIATATPPPWIWTRVHRHVHTLGILWLVYAGYTLLLWMMFVPFMAGMFHSWGMHGAPWEGFNFPFTRMPWLIPLITVATLIRGVLCVATGIGLLRRAPWARMLAIVAAFLTLIKLPFGTALAIYTLWVLLPGASGQEYEQLQVSSQ